MTATSRFHRYAELTIEQADLPVHLPVLVVAVLDGGVVVDAEGLLDELDGHGGLAHPTVAHKHQLREEEEEEEEKEEKDFFDMSAPPTHTPKHKRHSTREMADA